MKLNFYQSAAGERIANVSTVCVCVFLVCAGLQPARLKEATSVAIVLQTRTHTTPPSDPVMAMKRDARFLLFLFHPIN